MNSIEALGIKVLSGDSCDKCEPLFRAEIEKYTTANSEKIKELTGVPKEAIFQSWGTCKFTLFKVEKNYEVSTEFIINQDVITNMLSEEVKQKLIQNVRIPMLELISELQEHYKYYECPAYFSSYLRLYGFDEEIDKLFLNQITSATNYSNTKLSRALMEGLWEMYKVSHDEKFKNIFNSLKNEAIVSKKSLLQSYYKKMNRYYYGSNSIIDLCYFLKEAYVYGRFENELIENPKAEEYLREHGSIIKDFVINFPRNKKRLYQELIVTFKSINNDLKTYIFDMLKEDNLFNSILIMELVK